MRAADEELAEVALPGGVCEPQRDALGGRGEGGQPLRLHPPYVLCQHEAVDAGGERAGQSWQAGPEAVQFVEDFRLGRHELSPLGALSDPADHRASNAFLIRRSRAMSWPAEVSGMRAGVGAGRGGRRAAATMPAAARRRTSTSVWKAGRPRR